jgi:hypothetical protein
VGELRLGSGISMLKDGWQKWSRAVVFGGSAGGEKKGLTCGAHMSVTGEEKGGSVERASPKGKHLSVNAPRPFGTGLCGEAVTCEARWAGLGELGPFPGKVSKWKLILNSK